MAIPKDILAVQKPSSTVVKQRGTRFVVVKRTSKRVGNRVVPVDIGTVGEIIDGRFVERKPEAPRKKTAYSGRYPFTNSGDIRSVRW